MDASAGVSATGGKQTLALNVCNRGSADVRPRPIPIRSPSIEHQNDPPSGNRQHRQSHSQKKLQQDVGRVEREEKLHQQDRARDGDSCGCQRHGGQMAEPDLHPGTVTASGGYATGRKRTLRALPCSLPAASLMHLSGSLMQAHICLIARAGNLRLESLKTALRELPQARRSDQNRRFPCKFPLIRQSECGDRFAPDWNAHHTAFRFRHQMDERGPPRDLPGDRPAMSDIGGEGITSSRSDWRLHARGGLGASLPRRGSTSSCSLPPERPSRA